MKTNGNAWRRRKIAVVGSGISGLTAAYLLQRANDVTVFEADDRLGGHTHTHELLSGGRPVAVDSGFIVHNERTYPLLIKLFRELGIRTRSAEMSMSVQCDGCGLVYAGARGLLGFFPSPGNVVRGRYLALLAQVPRFHRAAREVLNRPEGDPEPTLGQFLAAGGFSPYFEQHFIVPLVSAVWSCAPNAVMDYPARYLFTFLAHHGMLSVGRSWSWRTVVGGSHTYVERIAEQLSEVRVSTGVIAVSRQDRRVQITDVLDNVSEFDAVIIAVHADQALSVLTDATVQERAVLSAFTYSVNETVLHGDASVLPRARLANSSWNYRLAACTPESGRAQVSYDMNRLQGLLPGRPLVVTLNGADRIRPGTVHAKMVYRHPVYTAGARAAQRHLPDLNRGVTAFAGSYHGWGFTRMAAAPVSRRPARSG